MVRVISFGQVRLARWLATVTFIALLAGAGLGVAFASSFSCPNDFFIGDYNKEGAAGSIDDGSSKFEYKSWAWNKDNTNYICHCVRNLAANPTRIEWKEINLSGWPKLKQTLFSMYSYEANDIEKRNTTIEYGPQRSQKHTIVPTVYPKISLGKQHNLDKLDDQIILAEYSEAKGPSHLSIGKTSVPNSEAVEGMTDDQIEKYLAENNNALSDFYMEFRSGISESDGKITRLTFECIYEISGDERSTMGFKIADPKVQMAVFKSDRPVFARMWGGSRMKMSGELKIEAKSIHDLETKTSSMQIVSEDNKILGSMPIVYFAGE
ncbi:hypothetical protein [Rhizobium leguminosarum]|uniref:hypothetical protein n=1 Tax=Rhizobium leguminosarum TaxID=384 RepID=UPI001441E0F2|nr:hypothetical protein [Rhizobium leguminosarum]NKL97667.1 hypothetical protein [Rhizobium leguminosarum bv. viciae]